MAKRNRRIRLTALGVILLGLWGMLALLLGTSVGMESSHSRTPNPDLEPGFGETHATWHRRASRPAEDLPPLCLGAYCIDKKDAVDTAYLGPPGHVPGNNAPGDDGDDATSAIGRPHDPETTPPTSTQGHANDPVPGWLFVPQGPTGDNPGGPEIENPNPGGPNIDNPPQNPGDTPPPNLTQPPFSNPSGPDGPGDGPNGPNGGPDGGPGGPPNGGQDPDPPQQLPEPLTLSLFAGGLAGLILLRRRRDHSSK